ncbi:Lipase maturation factor 2 [Nymphon striatum]|nr:Lipase maturation factor 2 [Nymphon striatum]
MGSNRQVKDTFLWWMGLIYFCAFASIYFQIPGLYGDQGILPAKLAVKLPPAKVKTTPTLIWLGVYYGIDIPDFMEIICLCGLLLSIYAMMSQLHRKAPLFFGLWFMYLSIYKVGQTFMHFQWDILLLEIGFLAIIVAPMLLPFIFKSSISKPHDSISLWLIKWLFFRLMFASGVVKLTSLCPTWWGLTALNYHFESQCIPTPFAWMFHHFPDWFSKLSVIMTLLIEIPIPFLFFSPIRSLRIFSYWCQVLLQTLIILTGNYNFFNMLTLTLAVSLLDDEFFFAFQDKQDDLTQEKFSSILTKSIPVTIWIGGISLASNIIYSLYQSLKIEGIFSKLESSIATICMACVAIFMFSISMVPHASVDDTAYQSIWPIVKQWNNNVNNYELTHAYGLFRRMTGVGGRPEIVIEGSNSINGVWKEYEFLYKPGNLSESPKFVVKMKLSYFGHVVRANGLEKSLMLGKMEGHRSRGRPRTRWMDGVLKATGKRDGRANVSGTRQTPHQPRLDWQMWFAALGRYHQNPWFINLINCLLENRKDVINLLNHNPFPDKPPKYIKATLYTYHYTSYNIKERRNNNWWVRKNPTEYLPVLTKDNPSLQEYLLQAGLNEGSIKRGQKNTTIPEVLGIVRGVLSSMKPHTFLWTVCAIAITGRIIVHPDEISKLAKSHALSLKGMMNNSGYIVPTQIN